MYKNYGLYGHKKSNFKFNVEEIFMRVIYEPAGKAKEYCELALNIYLGCEHDCLYCYAPRVTKTDRAEFKTPKLRKDILKKVAKEVHLYSGKKVLLSFISDPYPFIEIQHKATRQILEMFRDNNVIPVILSKSIYAFKDFDILAEAHGYFGTTLTLTNPAMVEEWEPKAASTDARIKILKKAKKCGIKTWVSLEPVIYPDQTLELIDLTHEFVDMYKVGKLNYLPNPVKIDWKTFAYSVVSKFKEYKSTYYIKNDLKSFM